MAKDLINILRGKASDDEKEIEADKEEEKPEIAAWMRKGLFAPEPEDKPTQYTFEKEDGDDVAYSMPSTSDEEEKPATQSVYPERKHKKHHKPCIVINLLAAALIGSHLYNLKHLAKSLNSL